MPRCAVLLACVLLWLAPLGVVAQEARSILTQDGRTITLTLELATTEASRAKGLMHRRSLPEDHGMLFVYDDEQIVYMWMKNTLIPLDMLFIDADGIIAHIVPDRQPHDLRPVSSVHPVRYVLELPAGSVDRHGISIGDTLR